MLFESSLRDRKESDLALRNFGDKKLLGKIVRISVCNARAGSRPSSLRNFWFLIWLATTAELFY
jgi:hypothetical protein